MLRTQLFLLALCLGVGLVTPAGAHDMKVFASRQAIPESAGKTTIYLAWGHRVPVDELTDAAALERYDLLPPSGTATPLMKEGVSLQENVVELKEPGISTVVAVRRASVYSYILDEEGERQLRRGPKTEHQGKVESGTRYQQCAKALIVVGEPGTAAPKAIGLPVEIVPLAGPARWKAGQDMPFQVLLHGKPLPTAEVHARFVGFKPDDAWSYATESNRRGEFSIRPGQAGTWLVRVTAKQLTQGSVREQYDFEGYTATLSLEVLP